MSALPVFLPALVRWLLYVATIGMVGVATFRWAVLEPLKTERAFALLAFPALRRAWAVGWTVATLGLFLLPLRFGVQAVALFGSDAMARSSGMLGTWWGLGWWLEAGATVLFAVGLQVAGAEGRRPGWVLVAFAALLAAVVPALSGHAADENLIGRAALLNDAVHMAAAGSWVGGLALVLLVGLPAAGEADVPRQLSVGRPVAALVLGRYSRVAVVAVALLLFTGTVNARIQVQSWAALTATPYGRTLLVKLALVVPAALLGLYHWRRVRPRIEEGLEAQRLHRTAAAEIGFALAVLVVTAMLALTPPPRSAAPMEPRTPAAVDVGR